MFEDFAVKTDVFRRLDEVCRPDAILATNTSSYSVTELAATTTIPSACSGCTTSSTPRRTGWSRSCPGRPPIAQLLRQAWRLQEALGKTPIASTDSSGFIVNRFFLPWLTEAVRMLEEGSPTSRRSTRRAKKAFGIGMGPFELMNVTGVPIALHAATTFGRAFGRSYDAAGAPEGAGAIGHGLGPRRHA